MRRMLIGGLAALVAVPMLGGPTAAAAPTTPTCGGKPVTKVVEKGPKPSDTVWGTPAADVLLVRVGAAKEVDGGGGNDVICAPAEGGTTVVGGDGDDVLIGGPGADVIIGGAGSDTITGGGGGDVCDEAGTACTYDALAPVLGTVIAVTPTTVDTSAAAAQVVFRVAVTDQLGFAAGQLTFRSPLPGAASLSAWFRGAHRVAGTERDGLYDVRVTVPKGSAATTWALESIYLADGRSNAKIQRGVAASISQTAAGDTAAPEVVSVAPLTATTIDTTTAPASVRYRIRITDQTGLQWGQVLFRSATSGASIKASVGARLSGTAQDGEYDLVLPVAQGTAPGVWSLDHVVAADPVGNARLSRAAASFVQVGGSDSAAPVVQAITAVDATRVDTCAAAATVRLRLRLTDDSGVSAGSVLLRSRLAEVGTLSGQLRRVAGTPTDGTYEAVVTVPRNAAATTWTLDHVWVSDTVSNNRLYAGATVPQPEGPIAITNGPLTEGGSASA